MTTTNDIKTEHQHPMGIKHRADSGFRKFRVHCKFIVGGQVRSSEMPYGSYPKSLPAS